MSDSVSDGIHLTKDYYKDFLPTDLQWTVTSVATDFTLYDLFRLVYHANHMIPGIFATMGMLEFHAFWDQINLDRDQDDINDITYLELYWHPDYDTRMTKQTGKSTDQPVGNCPMMDNGYNYWDHPKICDLSNLMGFHGVGPGCPAKSCDFHECGDDCPKDQGYAIEFTPLNNLAHLPIRICPEVEFFPPYVESDREFHRTGFQLTIDPTLWCFITSIFWELTFAGLTPNDVADHSKKLHDSMDEAKKHFNKNHDGEIDDEPIS